MSDMLMSIIWVIGAICAIWVIVDVLTKQKQMNTGAKVAWIVIAILLNFIGILVAIVYYLAVKMKKNVKASAKAVVQKAKAVAKKPARKKKKR
jgi:type VI protein secretion system component VasK